MQELSSLQKKFRLALTPFGKLCGLFMRARAFAYRRGLLPGFSPPAPTVSLGGPGLGTRGGVLLGAWLLGWAASKGLNCSVLLRPKEASPPDHPHKVELSDSPGQAGAEALLLARYSPQSAVMLDKDLIRAGKRAYKLAKPDLYLLYDCFSTVWMRRDIDLVLLGRDDVGAGYNQVLPAGLWKEDASSLNRARAVLIFTTPEDFTARRALIERRLAWLNKPVFPLHLNIWRLKRCPGNQSVEGINREPYALVSGEGDQEVTAAAVQALLGYAPRIKLVFGDTHRITSQDAEFVCREASRMRCNHILAAPREAAKLGGISGMNFLSFDPHVVFGEPLFCNLSFHQWWEKLWREEFLE